MAQESIKDIHYYYYSMYAIEGKLLIFSFNLKKSKIAIFKIFLKKCFNQNTKSRIARGKNEENELKNDWNDTKIW